MSAQLPLKYWIANPQEVRSNQTARMVARQALWALRKLRDCAELPNTFRELLGPASSCRVISDDVNQSGEDLVKACEKAKEFQRKSIKEDREEYRRRYDRGETKFGDKHKETQRVRYRIKHGIDPEAPVMTPQECAANARAVLAAKREGSR